MRAHVHSIVKSTNAPFRQKAWLCAAGLVTVANPRRETMQEGEKNTQRIEAFSDGVFAIAITLLVLELKVPHLHHEEASDAALFWALLDLWPSYMALVVSFITILIMWINHHRLLDLIRRCDGPFLMLNGLLLLFVTVVPFPTALLAEYFEHAGSRAACIAYTGLYVMIAITFNLMWHCARLRGLLKQNVTMGQVRWVTTAYVFGPAFYIAAFVSAFRNQNLSIAICAGLAMFFAFLPYDVPFRKAAEG
jgi:uncharacterized membrane protein